jgi:hypothetical protein
MQYKQLKTYFLQLSTYFIKYLKIKLVDYDPGMYDHYIELEI